MPRIPAVDRRVLTYGVEALNNGTPVPLTEVAYAVLRNPAKPVLTTEWGTVPVTVGVDGEDQVSITVAGSEAGTGDGVVLTRGTYRLYLRAVDVPESVTEAVDVITIE